MNARSISTALCLWLACLAWASAAIPDLRIRAGDHAGKPFELVRLDVETSIFGPAATTEFTFEYRNPVEGWQEGEMIIELRPGEEIAGFQLEVDGEFREGVAAPRGQARSVYERIVNRRIDPGIVEWLGENRYKLNVYPIVETRRFKLSIDHLIQTSEPEHRFELPLGVNDSPCSVRLRISGVRGDPKATADGEPLQLSRDSGWFTGETTSARQSIEVSYVSEPEVRLGSCVIPAKAPAPRPVPEFPGKVAIFWDCSRSSADRDRAAELDFLEARLSGREVSWICFDVAERARGEGLAALREAVESHPPDGATNLGQLDFAGKEAVILVSDGTSTLGAPSLPLPGVPVFSVCSAAGVDGAFFRELARETGGAFFDLKTSAPGDPGRPPIQIEPSENGAEPLPGFGRRAAARQQLLELMSPWQSGAGPIQDHCREHGLVSRWSSLIVLEQIRDYLDSGIRPPGALAAEYDRQANQPQPWRGDRKEFISSFQRWRDTKFPVVDAADYEAWTPEFDRRLSQTKFGAASRKWQIQRRRAYAKAFAEFAEKTPHPQPHEITRLTDVLFQSQGKGVHGHWSPWQRGSVPAAFLLKPQIVNDFLHPMMGDPFSDGSELAGANRVVVDLPPAPHDSGGGNSRGDSNATPSLDSSRFRPWDGGPGVAAKFESRAVQDWPEVYQQLLGDHGDDLAFFLEAGKLLFRNGHRELAVRAVSNLAELGFGNALELRRAAMRFAAWEERELAANLFGRIAELERGSLAAARQHALQLEPKLAAAKLSELAEAEGRETWSFRLLMLREANALSSDTLPPEHRLDPAVDLRILLSWDDPDVDLDLYVTDPEGETCYFNQQQTRLGGLLNGDSHFDSDLEEFQLRQAPSGDYRIEVRRASWNARRAQSAPPTVYIEVIQNFGRENETRQKFRAPFLGTASLAFPIITVR